MVQTEKMLSVGGLAAGMAHEINNPLSGMLQSARISSDGWIRPWKKNNTIAVRCGTTLESIRAYLEERGIIRFIDGIRQSGERATTTVSDMLHFSRPSDSRMAPASLAELVDKTVAWPPTTMICAKNTTFVKLRSSATMKTTCPWSLAWPLKSDR